MGQVQQWVKMHFGFYCGTQSMLLSKHDTAIYKLPAAIIRRDRLSPPIHKAT